MIDILQKYSDLFEDTYPKYSGQLMLVAFEIADNFKSLRK